MSDTETSGAPSSAPVATAGTTPSVGSPGTPPIGAFGSTRGSGLARGKRPTPAAAGAAGTSGAPSGYKPSALEVIRTQSEYKNPFTGETSVGAPASPEPAERIINEPAPQAASSEIETPVASAPPVSPSPAPAARPAPAVSAAPAAELFPFNAPGSPERTPAEKAELKILPPAETKRPATSWEAGGPSAADDRRNERPTFRPDRRDAKPFEPREAKPFEPRESRDGKPFVPREQRDQKPFAPREPRRDGQPRNFEPRSGQQGSQSYQGQGQNRAPRPEEPKKSGGFFGWLKDLFGGKPAETPAQGRSDGDQRRERDGGEFGHDGQRRRHRGGRGRGGFQGENRGPRDGQPYQPRDPRDEEASSQAGGDRGYSGGGQGENREGGGGRRRRRGGRGRYRGEGGGGGGADRGNDPRPEGQQGGGAI